MNRGKYPNFATGLVFLYINIFFNRNKLDSQACREALVSNHRTVSKIQIKLFFPIYLENYIRKFKL